MSNDDDYYPMGTNDDPNKKRGRCVILHYRDYKDKTRHGSENDVTALVKTFGDLNFEIIVHDNLTKAGTQLVLETIEKDNVDHSDYYCFVLCILAHGIKNEFECIDDQTFAYTDVYQLLDGCKSLLGKPKLFFIQACQGKDINTGNQLSPDQSDPTVITVTYSPVSENDPNLLPKIVDFLWFVCTYDGHVSMRSHETGSWFIQELCKELNQNAKKKDLFRMLTAVNNRVSMETATRKQVTKFADTSKEDVVDSVTVKQSPGFNSRLRKAIKFY